MSSKSSDKESPLLSAVQSAGWSTPPSARQSSLDGGTPPAPARGCWDTLVPAIQAAWLLAILVACAIRPCVLSLAYLVAFFFQVQLVAAASSPNSHRSKLLWGSLAGYSLADIIAQAVFRAVDGDATSDSLLALFGFWEWSGVDGALQAFGPPVAVCVIASIQFILAGRAASTPTVKIPTAHRWLLCSTQ
jgi:hypothetical protein